MKSTGLLRWRDLTGSLQRQVAKGVMGEGLRLSQLAEGSWTLMESEVLPTGAPRLANGVLYPGPITGAGGLPALIGGTPSDAEPEPGLTLTEAQLTLGTGYVVYARSAPGDEWESPSVFEVAAGLVAESSPTLLKLPILLIRSGRAVRVSPTL